MTRVGPWLLALALTATPAAAATPAALSLTPGIALESPATAGQIGAYHLRIDAGERAVLAVEQLGADVVITARWGSDEHWRVDAPLDRDGTEIFLLPPSARGAVEVEVELRVASATGSAPRFRIRLDLLPEVTAEGPKLEALGALTAAGRGYAEGTGDGRRRALPFYRRASELWRALGEEHMAAQSLFAAGVLHRLLGEHAHGLELARQVLPAWQALGDREFEAATWNGIGLMESSAGRTTVARQAFTRARAAQAGGGDPYRRAAIANNLCLTHLIDGNLRRGIECYGPALETIRAAGDRETESVVLGNVGRAYRKLGQPVRALHALEQALEVLRGGEFPKREAQTLTHLGMLRYTLGEPIDAVRLHLQALDVFRRLGDRLWQAHTLYNLGLTYKVLGDLPRAEALLREGLAIHQELERQSGEASSWKAIGHVLLADGEPAAAVEAYRQAHELEISTATKQGEAVTMSFLAEAELELGDPATALATLAPAIDALRGDGTASILARALVNRGRSLTLLAEPAAAAKSLAEALEVYRRIGSPHGEGLALLRLAQNHRASGQIEAARTHLDQAVEILETLRVELGDPDLQATFAGARRLAYELQAELLAMDGGDESLAAALAASERARAWGITELLRRTGSSWTAELKNRAPELAERLRAARRQLHAAAGRRDGLNVETRATERRQADTAVAHALAELEELEATARESFPGTGGRASQATLTLAEVQDLLEADTALLEYLVGEERSFLFVVTVATLHRFELPGRVDLEAAVLRARREIGDSGAELDAWLHGSAAELARHIVLPALPVLEAAGIERLAIVADDALHYLPFAALPVPAGPRQWSAAGGGLTAAQALLERFEVTHLPAAGALVLERRRRAGRPPAPRPVAVLADPVFDPRDLRLPTDLIGASSPANPTRDFAVPAGLELPRLRASRREAEAIAALAPPGDSLVALGFDAHRDRVVDGHLEQYRVLHFATHGIVNDRHAVLSGLVLSRFDANGRPRDGFLRLRDIYLLDLRADLVVLSACRTALGKEVRSEGLLGLTRAFLHAGASRVMASLWSVPDRATAELMERFYRALWRDGLAPSAALRRAQRSMLGEHRWSAPNLWAGFVVAGDWRAPPPMSANGGEVR